MGFYTHSNEVIKAMSAKISIIDDSIEQGLIEKLSKEGYNVVHYDNAEQGLKGVLSSHPDILLLDLVLPQKSGYEILRELREKRFESPIIVISQKTTLTEKVVCLEIGADDFISKPVVFEELNARIKASLRRSSYIKKEKREIIEIDKLKIDLENYYIEKNGEEIRLSNYEFEILKLLLDKRGKPVSREELIEKIWDNKIFISSRTIDNHIVNLRKKMEDSYKRPKYIITVYRKGYKFKY